MSINLEQLARSILMPGRPTTPAPDDFIRDQIIEAYVRDGMKESEIAESFGMTELDINTILEQAGV